MRRLVLGVAFAAIAGAIFFARPVATPGPALRDFEAYWSGGAAWNAGENPYGRAIWNHERTVAGVAASRDELLPFVGPPATLLLWSPFARLAYDRAAAIWIAVLAAALVALVAVAVRGSAAPLGAPSFLAGLALAIGFGPLSSDLALGQIALPAFACAALVVLARSQWICAAAACLAFAQPNASAGLASLLGRNRATVAMALGVAATYLLGALAAGWSWPVAYARVLSAHAGAERLSAIQITPAAIAYGLGASPAAAAFVGLVCAAAGVAAAILLARGVRDAFARFAAFSALIPFVAAFVHEHDLLAAFPAAAWCALRARGATRAVALTGTLLVGVDWLGLAQRPTGIFQSALLALAALMAFAALGEMLERGPQWIAAAVVAPLFVAGALAGAHHPAPVWPDALLHFHAPAAASAAQVWLDEQRASGLLAAVPVWALLRALSLAGCALLAYAIYRRSTSDRTA
jgi:Glycosyltransferase family 87